MIVELRQYTLHPGQRDTLITLFEREFVSGQEQCGMSILGRFRDLGDPDRFVWFRGFDNMEQRKEALTCFYDGPLWRAHRNEANATMIDSDDVLLLRHVKGEHVFDQARYTAMVYFFDAVDDDLVAQFEDAIVLRTHDAENTFPRLPVRSGEQVVVTINRGDEPRALNSAIATRFVKPPQRLLLEPVSMRG